MRRHRWLLVCLLPVGVASALVAEAGCSSDPAGTSTTSADAASEARAPVPDARAGDVLDGGAPSTPDPCIGQPTGPNVLLALGGDGGPNINARLTPDELTVVFASIRGDGGLDIYTATRTTRSTGFPDASRIDAVSTDADETAPYLTADARTLLFARANDLWIATRASATAPFGAAVPVPGAVNTADIESSPYLDEQGAALYYTSVPVASINPRILRAPLDGGAPELVLVGGPTSDVSSPVLSADGLTIYFTDVQLGDIYRSKRIVRGAPFLKAQWVESVSDPSDAEFASWLSADSCRLYYDTTGTFQPVVASRPH
jgi:hypothetical protein